MFSGSLLENVGEQTASAAQQPGQGGEAVEKFRAGLNSKTNVEL